MTRKQNAPVLLNSQPLKLTNRSYRAAPSPALQSYSVLRSFVQGLGKGPTYCLKAQLLSPAFIYVLFTGLTQNQADLSGHKEERRQDLGY